MMKNFNIPIVTDVPPDTHYTAGQVLNRIISSISSEKFDFYWVNHSNLPGHIGIPTNCVIKEIFGFQLTGFWWRLAVFLQKGSKNSSIFRRFAVLVRLAMWAAKSILIGWRLGRNLRRSSSKIVWYVVQGEKTVLCYTIAAFVSGKKFILHQWDPLSWWMTHRSLPRLIQGPMRVLLNRLEQRAEMNVVPSDAWALNLNAQGKKSMRLDNFFDDPVGNEDAPVFISDPGTLHAVFVGQFYSNVELEKLINQLQLKLHNLEKKLVIHCFGHGTPGLATNNCRIVTHGSLPRDELIKRISKWDLALLPYPTEDRFLETSSFSFPSKSRVYLAAGLPILSWARVGSSPDIFYSEKYHEHYQNATVETRLDDFIKVISAASPSYRNDRYSAAQRILAEQFSYSAELIPFKEFLLKNA